jgi:hypothetical protein
MNWDAGFAFCPRQNKMTEQNKILSRRNSSQILFCIISIYYENQLQFKLKDIGLVRSWN